MSYPGITITYPPVSYNMVTGSPAPLYPTYVGALVLDVQLKRWGKYKGGHKLLLDYTTQNNNTNGSIPYTNFGIRSGSLNAAGRISLFDAAPTDSWIRYGKAGYYRLGTTQFHEIKAHFRVRSTGVIREEVSLHGRNIEANYYTDTVFTNQQEVVAYSDMVGRWHTVTISGQWDLSYPMMSTLILVCWQPYWGYNLLGSITNLLKKSMMDQAI